MLSVIICYVEEIVSTCDSPDCAEPTLNKNVLILSYLRKAVAKHSINTNLRLII